MFALHIAHETKVITNTQFHSSKYCEKTPRRPLDYCRGGKGSCKAATCRVRLYENVCRRLTIGYQSRRGGDVNKVKI